MGRIVIVSNRLPPLAARGSGQAGGLAVALRDATKSDVLWFGWSGRTGAKTSTTATMHEVGSRSFASIDLSQDDYRHFYVGYANGVLWPLLHFRLGLIEYRSEDMAGYYAVNQAFAAALAPLLKPDDLVWVHDYHLIPLAAALRERGVTNRIGFFLHIPFVPSSIFMALPRGEKLLREFCLYDVIGFQTEPDCDSFVDCLHHMLGIRANGQPGHFQIGEHHLWAIAQPIGIDARGFARQAERSARGREAQRLRESLSDRQLIIGADRLDYSKGLPQRFEAYRRLLDRVPQDRRKVSYLQVAARSREDVNRYRELRRELDRLVGAINGRFAEFDWVPLRYMTRPIARTILAGFFRIARVGLVTPLRDGMNLVAKEYVAAQDPADPGVLILSRFAGAARELDAALLVNPYDPDDLADNLERALAMGLDERRQRHEAMLAKVRQVTAATWCRDFLARLADPGVVPVEPDRGGHPLAHADGRADGFGVEVERRTADTRRARRRVPARPSATAKGRLAVPGLL
jgi:trehalose 6-phosphate synthase